MTDMSELSAALIPEDAWVDALAMLWDAYTTSADELLGWGDDDLTRALAAAEMLDKIARAVKSAIKAAAADIHPEGFSRTSPGVGTLRVKPNVRKVTDWSQTMTILFRRTLELTDSDPLPATLGAFINLMLRLLPAGTDIKVTELDAMDIARGEVIRTETAAPSVTYTPPKDQL